MIADTLKDLCALPGVSGFEDPVRDYIREKIEPSAADIRTDAMGTLIAEKKGKRTPDLKILLSAHMDEVGLMITHITDEGFLRFDCVGGIDRRVLIGQRVFVGRDAVPGVVGMKAVHLCTAEEMQKIPRLEEFYIDIGAESREEAEEKTHLGDFVSFDPESAEFGDNMFRSKAVDDRAGCAVLLDLFQRELPLDCTFAFTVQEEVGCRGAFGAAFSVKPDIALVLESTTAADLPEVPARRRVCEPGRGPVISLMDGGTVYDRELFTLMTEAADKKNIPWQVKHYIAGGNDARAVQRSRGGVRVAGLSLAARYLHAPVSVASLQDLEEMPDLALGFLEALADRAGA
ncbi:MAG: M42 family metallopeptidase [Oscillospiraceae bacterium]|nr:M42 family metallopeptidase [Oscillospiraceae bacterium]